MPRLSFRPERSASTIWRKCLPARPSCSIRPSGRASRRPRTLSRKPRARDVPAYGINTGFGKLASTRIAAGPDDAASAQSHRVALLRGRAADARTDRASDDGAEDHLARARCFGRAPRSHRAAAGHAGARRLSAGAAAGIGRRIRRSGAACAYDGRHDRRGAGARRRQDRAGPRGARRRRSHAVDARAEGRSRVDQRHAVLDRLCHLRLAARPSPGLRRARDGRLVGRCGDGVDGAVSPRDPAAARACRADRRRRGPDRVAGGQRYPAVASRRRRARAGSLLPALPAAGRRARRSIC